MKKLILLLLALILTPVAAGAAVMHTLEINFTFTAQDTADRQLLGYRLYKDGMQVCETSSPNSSTLTCQFPADDGTFVFTLSAYYSNGDESPQSPPYPYTIESLPILPADGQAGITTPDSQGSSTVSYSWENGVSNSLVAGYRMYLNDLLLCESSTPDATSLDCQAALINGPMVFSVASFDAAGNESERTIILLRDASDFPDLFPNGGGSSNPPIHTLEIDFTFVAPNSGEQHPGGYRLYQDGVPVCESSDPAASKLTCEFATEEGTFTFTLTALYTNGTESPHSPPFPFTIDSSGGPGTSPPPLQATIDPTPAGGEVPYNVTFSGTGSTGDIVNYAWDFGDGTSDTGLTVDHSYTVAGIYTVTLQVTDQSGATHQATTTVSATYVPPPLPPTAILSSSTAAGTAPLAVSFDGSASTTLSPPIVSYSWSFGDGSQATGTTASHTFTTAGTYQAKLTVTDSKGLSDTVTTPIIVIEPIPVNQKPAAVIASDVLSGYAPLTVTFDGSGSSDPDGSIAQYHWTFGDGTTATGASVQHTFTDAEIFTVSLQVTDNSGDTATASSAIVCEVPPPELSINLEVGEVTIDQTWVKVLFSKTFKDPVVVAGPPTSKEADPVLVRIRNIDQQGFEVRLQEWNYQNGSHRPETLSYIVMDRGTYTLDNGIKLEAGTFTGTKAFRQVPLQQAYSATPVILAQIVSNNDPDAVTGRTRNVSTTAFEYLLQEQQSTKTAHGNETVGYIAWEPGRGELPGLIYEVGLTPKSVSHLWYDLGFQAALPEAPYFLAAMQTTSGIDTAAVRSQLITQTMARIKIEEEQSKDSEIKHTTEVVGYLTISAVDR